MPSVTIVYNKAIPLLTLLLAIWGFTGAALLTSENISAWVVIGVWTLYLAMIIFAARAAFTRKIILEEHRIGWHNGVRRNVKWYPRKDIVAAYQIDHRRDATLHRAVKPYKGHGIVVRNPQANTTMFWLVTHSTTLSRAALARVRGIISPAKSATILVIYRHALKDARQAEILKNYIRGSTRRFVQ